MRYAGLLAVWPFGDWLVGAGASGMDGFAATVGCGPTDRTHVPGGQARCKMALEHDCTSMVTLQKFCPPECPYVAPHPDLSCVFECASADRCHEVNAEFAFPNESSKVCEPCSIVGCQRCVSRDLDGMRCDLPLPGFRLELDGRICTFDWDSRVKERAPPVVIVVVVSVILVLAMVTLIDACGCCGGIMPAEDRPEVSEQADDAHNPLGPTAGESVMDGARDMFEHDLTLKALNQGKRHRLRCKIKDLDLAPDANAKSLYDRRPLPFMVNLRERFLAGVGLPLFHQWYYFLFLYSCLMCGGTAWVFYSSGLNDMLQNTGLDDVGELLSTRDHGSLCSVSAGRGSKLEATMREFEYRAAWGYLALWVLGLCLTLSHAARQKRVAAEFYRKHACLAEFALNVEGFPPEATDEATIRRFLREAFGHNGLEVSICYDYRLRKDRVHELLEKLIVAADVRAKTYDQAICGLTELGLNEDERAEVRSWLPGSGGGAGAPIAGDSCGSSGSRTDGPLIPGGAAGGAFQLQNAGTVFAVLPHNYDLQTVRRKFDNAPAYMPRRSTQRTTVPMLPHQATPEWLPVQPLRWVGQNGEMYNLSIRDVVCEPTDVGWEHLGMPERSFRCRVLFGSVVILFSFALMAGLLFYPLALYAIMFVHQAGSLPTGIIHTLLGLLIMTGNWLMCLLHIQVSGRMGHSRRDREALVIFKVFALLCLSSFLFNVTMTIWPSSQGGSYRFLFHQENYFESMQDMSFQVTASGHLFHVLVPGGLFFGYLIFPLQGFVWPFASVLTFRRWWHRLNFVHDLTARKAEKELEPLGYSAGHDYMGNVVQPVSCSIILFFASGYVWQLWACLAGWSVFMMIFSRYLHLRAVRRCYFTTSRVDTEALVWFAAPLSLVLASSGFWAARLRGWSPWVVLFAWIFGGATYFFLLTAFVRPSLPKEEGHACFRPGYDEVRACRFYDWHNCNPIKVLLSHCQGEAEGGTGEGITPFEIGKEYLQAREFSTAAFRRAPSIQTGMTRQYSEPDKATCCFSCLDVPEVETLLGGGPASLQQRTLQDEGPPKPTSHVAERRRRPAPDSGAPARRSEADAGGSGRHRSPPRTRGRSESAADAARAPPPSSEEAASSPGPSDSLLEKQAPTPLRSTI